MSYAHKAVLRLWQVRDEAAAAAAGRGANDESLRAGVTSGKHLDDLAKLVADEFVAAGIAPGDVHYRRGGVVLPGYFRAEKQWDILVKHAGRLVAAVEFKSMLGSVGNNLNNRVEESLGNATDLQHAAEAGLLGSGAPWLGYVYVIEDLPELGQPIKVAESHFSVDPAFKGATYETRLTLYMRRLVLRRLYDAAWLVIGDPTNKRVREPAEDLTWAKFSAAIAGRVGEVLA